MSYFAPVVPPADHKDPDARYHFVKWDVLIADEDLRSELTGTLGDDTHRFTGSATLPEGGPEAFTFLEFTPLDGQLASWDVSVEAATLVQGTGLLNLASNSLPAEVAGDEPTQAYILAVGLIFPEATITIPRRQQEMEYLR